MPPQPNNPLKNNAANDASTHTPKRSVPHGRLRTHAVQDLWYIASMDVDA